MSAPNFNTKVARLVLKKGKIPTTQPFCVLPGADEGAEDLHLSFPEATRRPTGVGCPRMLLPSRPSMVSVVVCLVLGLVLVAAAGLKLAGGARARAALATLRHPRSARGVRRLGGR